MRVALSRRRRDQKVGDVIVSSDASVPEEQRGDPAVQCTRGGTIGHDLGVDEPGTDVSLGKIGKLADWRQTVDL